MNLDKQEYEQYVAAHAKKSPLLRDTLRAFFVGGVICAMGEGLCRLYGNWFDLPRADASTWSAVSLVFLAVVLTALGIFDKIAHIAGAGTLVPITGFANAVASPAIDSRAEGLVLGIGAKIFTVAGPVLLYGTLAGTAYGLLYYFLPLLFA